jgi:hypothetical protein
MEEDAGVPYHSRETSISMHYTAAAIGDNGLKEDANARETRISLEDFL